MNKSIIFKKPMSAKLWKNYLKKNKIKIGKEL